MRSALLWLGAMLLVAGATIRPPAPTVAETHMLPMRDGVRLATDVYLPSGAPPYPVILIRTPYDKNALKPIGEDGARQTAGRRCPPARRRCTCRATARFRSASQPQARR